MRLEPDVVDVHVGRRVREVRLLRNLTQEELGEKIGVSYQQVQKYETGANRISASRLYRIAVEFDVLPGWFFEGIERVNVELPSSAGQKSANAR